MFDDSHQGGGGIGIDGGVGGSIGFGGIGCGIIGGGGIGISGVVVVAVGWWFGEGDLAELVVV